MKKQIRLITKKVSENVVIQAIESSNGFQQIQVIEDHENKKSVFTITTKDKVDKKKFYGGVSM